MYTFSKEQFDCFFDFLKTLDCYNKTQDGMIEELNNFETNPKRQIASFVCQNTKERLTYRAPYIRILYVLIGSVKILIDDKELLYKAGCLVLANEWTVVEYEEMEAETTMLSFYFKKEYFNDSLLAQFAEEPIIYRFFVESIKETEENSHYFIFQFSPNEDIHVYALLLLKQIVKMRYFNNKVTKSAFVLFVVEISQLSDKGLCVKDSNLSSGVLVEEILAHIETHLTTVTLSETAEKFHFHPNYLSAFIKKQTDKNFSDWVIHYRLRYAETYLRQTDLPIQTIIEEIGYQDKAFFFKLFKDHYQTTPGKYRKLAKNNAQ
ncbi:helix-turn-helix domain-containing protein [Enterococcus wangshanyuanii]|uniref:AraC family transcriptional regulator n=1 Tax=Enterococcus wangshanyuanii TaxID=2005703 RepID=A0ABQ1NKY3_9ENTE|nr:AraC family transcriptional regulator [Enterococcus wangshanyuanii]GGC77988.1 AraC family transcriptional regulator [Enterococcus wangshanyuanii]